MISLQFDQLELLLIMIEQYHKTNKTQHDYYKPPLFGAK